MRNDLTDETYMLYMFAGEVCVVKFSQDEPPPGNVAKETEEEAQGTMAIGIGSRRLANNILLYTFVTKTGNAHVRSSTSLFLLSFHAHLYIYIYGGGHLMS